MKVENIGDIGKVCLGVGIPVTKLARPEASS
jgi:hypothetical protein